MCCKDPVNISLISLNFVMIRMQESEKNFILLCLPFYLEEKTLLQSIELTCMVLFCRVYKIKIVR